MPDAPQPRRQPRILVVDDDRLMLALLQGILRHEGYDRVDFARDGKESLGKVLQRRPEIIFLDIEMPGMDGIETLAAIKEFGIVSQVVMMTARPTAKNVMAAKDGGAACFLVKPLSARKVLDSIEACRVRAEEEEGDIELFIAD